MVRSAFAVLFASCLLAAPDCLGQGQTALPFLLVSPSARGWGMGEASVALCTDDPLAPASNPAHIGMQSRTGYFSSGYNYYDWMPGGALPDLWWKTFAFNAGINLKKQFGITPELYAGFGYSRVYLNYGSSFTSGTFNAYESSDQYTAGAGIDSWVRASAGVTLKHVVSYLADFYVQGQEKVAKTTLNTYDYGLLLDVPVISILARLREEPVEVLPHMSPFFDVSMGFAKNNLGDGRVVYIDPTQGDPLPRYARIGIGFDLGMVYEIGGGGMAPGLIRMDDGAERRAGPHATLGGGFSGQRGEAGYLGIHGGPRGHRCPQRCRPWPQRSGDGQEEGMGAQHPRGLLHARGTL